MATKTDQVNNNDVIRIELKVNGKLFQIQEHLCNSEEQFQQFVKDVFRNIKFLSLEQLSRFKE